MTAEYVEETGKTECGGSEPQKCMPEQDEGKWLRGATVIDFFVS